MSAAVKKPTLLFNHQSDKILPSAEKAKKPRPPSAAVQGQG